MSWPNLFGDDSNYQIDHIIPRSVFLDDSFVNKVLCHAGCNSRKGDRTPYQAFAPENGGDPKEYDAMIKFVSRLKGEKKTVEEKLKRFKMDASGLEEFLKRRTAQQFNDSAYASRLAADYIGLLYGGRTDTQGNLRVQVRSGGITQHFREAWNLNSILGDGGSANGGKVLKPRHDHRHHAIDAAVIAVTDQGMVSRLNAAARQGRRRDRPGRFGDFDEPWPGFRSDLIAEADRMVVSHRVSNRVSGSLHKDANYSVDDERYGKGIRRHRVPVTELSELDVMSDKVIADAGVRKLLQTKLVECGGQPKKAFTEHPPCFETADGVMVPIRKVRINETVKTRQVGKGYHARFVKPENHHLEIYAILDPRDPERDMEWSSDGVVTMLEALQRLHDGHREKGQTPIKKDGFGQHTKFKFSLAPGEILECDAERNGVKLLPARKLSGEEQRSGRVKLIVRSISQEEKRPASIKVEMVHINEARQNVRYPDRVTKSPSELFKWNARKIVVTPLGEVREARE